MHGMEGMATASAPFKELLIDAYQDICDFKHSAASYRISTVSRIVNDSRNDLLHWP